jgi:hypothetical protein
MIYTSSSNYLYIENQFLYLFTYFICSLDRALIKQKHMGSGIKILKTQANSGLDRELIHYFPRGSYAIASQQTGIYRSEPSDRQQSARIRLPLHRARTYLQTLDSGLTGPRWTRLQKIPSVHLRLYGHDLLTQFIN